MAVHFRGRGPRPTPSPTPPPPPPPGSRWTTATPQPIRRPRAAHRQPTNQRLWAFVKGPLGGIALVVLVAAIAAALTGWTAGTVVKLLVIGLGLFVAVELNQSMRWWSRVVFVLTVVFAAVAFGLPQKIHQYNQHTAHPAATSVQPGGSGGQGTGSGAGGNAAPPMSAAPVQPTEIAPTAVPTAARIIPLGTKELDLACNQQHYGSKAQIAAADGHTPSTDLIQCFAGSVYYGGLNLQDFCNLNYGATAVNPRQGRSDPNGQDWRLWTCVKA